jgi:flotillin
VFYGKKSKITLIEQHPDPDNPGRMKPVSVTKISGHSVISGGAKFRWPIVEDVAFLDLDAFQLGIKLSNIPNIDGVPVSIEAVATCKIQSDKTSLMTAVERFLSKPEGEIHAIVKENLEGQLRAVVGTMNVEELIQNREKLNTTVKSEAAEELAKLGVGIEILNIQSITDNTGYIDALGKKRTAEVKRDAEIGTAEAGRDARKASTNAVREGSVVAASNDAKVAEAEKERDTAKARYLAEIQAEQARAAQAGPKAEAVARQQVVVEQVKVEEEDARARIAVQEQKIMVAEKEQEATVVVPARKAADAKAAHAEGDAPSSRPTAGARPRSSWPRRRSRSASSKGRARRRASRPWAKARRRASGPWARPRRARPRLSVWPRPRPSGPSSWPRQRAP